VNELYAEVFLKIFNLQSIGLRYFNVFGPRQDPQGPYAAVIPKWFNALIKGEDLYINGDGETTRDFCFIDNVIQANILAAFSPYPDLSNYVFNIAFGKQTTLNNLFKIIRKNLLPTFPDIQQTEPMYRDFRVGDVKHSLANFNKAQEYIGYDPLCDVEMGIKEISNWYILNS